MKRKFEIGLKQWLPFIAVCIKECEVVDLLSIHKYCGRALVVLGDEGQFKEITSIVEFLKQNAYFKVDTQLRQETWHGISFHNESYIVNQKMTDLIDVAFVDARNNQDITSNINTETNNYVFNFSFIFEKLIEMNPSLRLELGSLMPFLKGILGL